jgi:hypothetical protein
VRHAQAGGGKFEGQGQAVQAAGNGRDGGRVLGREREAGTRLRRALDKYLHRRAGTDLRQRRRLCRLCRQRQRQHGELVLVVQVEQGAAGHEHLQARGGVEQPGYLRGGIRHLLEVVQHQQEVALVQVLVQ